MKKRCLCLVTLMGLLGLVGCGDPKDAGGGATKPAASSGMAAPIKRWYSRQHVDRGNLLYQTHCAGCHQADASGTSNWRQPDAEGRYPPPPLNGTAHTWHHPLTVLRRTVRIGGVPLGGSMPAFADILNAQEIDDILAWLQSHWSDRIYAVWHERDQQARRPVQALK